jgi:hypothetical protein
MRTIPFIEITFIVMLFFLSSLVFIPRVTADFTYITDDTYPEMGWIDVEQVGWEVESGITLNTLLLEVKYQESLPPCTLCGCLYTFSGTFYLDTDRNPTTGSPYTETLTTAPRGTDYYISFSHAGSCSYASLYEWDDRAMGWIYIKELDDPSLNIPTNDTVTIPIPLADIDSPLDFDIVLRTNCGFIDWNTGWETLEIYNIESEDRPITVDGASTIDWLGSSPDFSDPSGDTIPGWADFTDFYFTDDSSTNLFFTRMDFATLPLRLHPEENSMVRQTISVYFDSDQDGSTGYEWYGIGADYETTISITTHHDSQRLNMMLLSWDPATEGGTLVWDETATLDGALDTCLESSVLLSDIDIIGRTDIPIFVNKMYTQTYDRVPNTGAITADTRSPTIGPFRYILYTGLIIAVITSGFLLRRFLVKRKH